ncbi:LOW QUALITY PROTEIN: hypothetical protein PanWU01x14_248100 [Parasponia andersonii]|uniref:Uncharacterized protein n=1 Tax=Parasponia andersonii TaxID=3476 RepID=A0A2P5BDY8_PARAD|nr:LOW QUALITY PROTEIN: hypothetical protein PanWU01x14_248100 [Parasponia andersonii]
METVCFAIQIYDVQVMLGKYILNKSSSLLGSISRTYRMFTLSVQKSKIKIEGKRREKFSSHISLPFLYKWKITLYKNKITATRLIIKNAQHGQDNFGCGDIPEKPLSSVEEELNV